MCLPVFSITFDTAAVIFVGGLCAAIIGIIYELRPKPLAGIPHSPVKWFWGDLDGLLTASNNGVGDSRFFGLHSLRYGPLCQMLLGPFTPSVVVSDPREIEDIMTRRGPDFELGDRFHVSMSYTIPKGHISMRDGPMWRNHRRLMSPSMSPRYLSQMTPRIHNNIRNLLDLWEAKYSILQSTASGAVFNVKEDIQLSTMDTIADIAFTEPFGGVRAAIDGLPSSSQLKPNVFGAVDFPAPVTPHHEAVHALLKLMGKAASSTLPLLTYHIYGYLNPTWRAAKKHLKGIVTAKICDYRRKFEESQTKGDSVESADSVLEMLFEREGKDGPDMMPDDEIVDEMLMFLMAGHETTAAAFCWGLKYLTDNPHIQRKLRGELMHAFDVAEGTHRILSYDEAQSGNSPYLDAVVAETLRLAGVAPLLCRQAKRDTYILGKFIPKGTDVIMLSHHTSMYDTVANQHIYAKLDPLRSPSRKAMTNVPPWTHDGLAFYPERWLDAEGKFNPRAGPNYAFGAGPRMCFGNKLATLQLKLGFASLSLAFFLDKLPHRALDGYGTKEAVTRPPLKAFVNLKKWKEVTG